jgi:hypothetical protein
MPYAQAPLNRALAEDFERWREEVKGEREMQSRELNVRRIVMRLMNSAVVASFERMREQAREPQVLQ